MLKTYLNPLWYFRKISDRLWLWYGPKLRLRLSRTPLMWGDRDRIKIGNQVKLTDTIINARSGDVIIEDYVSIAHGSMLLTGTHDFTKINHDRFFTVPDSGRDIIVREGAWIASGCIIIGPCEIGAHSVIASGSLVLGDVDAGWIYGGSPAKPIKKIEFSDTPLGSP